MVHAVFFFGGAVLCAVILGLLALGSMLAGTPVSGQQVLLGGVICLLGGVLSAFYFHVARVRV